ncbi:MAG: hypothetical protein SRB2_00739 [Desulfobacteraceae bacterium Eth-SRB2]|nr:MAG: hypothetical protein SRB2_00739 [Desulfobacteraceae bacterium Eth-SRB2]
MEKKESSFKGYFFCVFVLSLMLCSTIAFGATIHVPADYKTIQEAIDGAFDGDTVLVADGKYTGSGNKNLDFNGKELTVQSENGPKQCIIDCESDGRGFYFHTGELQDARVSGFTITNGRVKDKGGGIYCGNSSPTITNCIIINNTAVSSSNNSQGGGIYLGTAGSSTITNCVIARNTSNYQGGGIYTYNARPTITNCTITRNVAVDGGGIYVRYKPVPTLTNCILYGNTPNQVVKESVNTNSPKIIFSIVEGGYSGWGNINVDPLFIGSGDFYHLTKKSPAINAGISREAPKIDIDGDPRPKGKRIDIGADEYVGN